MIRYIDADALIEEVKTLEQLARKRVYDTPTNSPAYERYATQYSERERILNIIKAHPTADVVEVVRCKDCKHFKDEGTDGQYCQYHTKSAGENCDGAFWVAKNDFCSYGERREV